MLAELAEVNMSSLAGYFYRHLSYPTLLVAATATYLTYCYLRRPRNLPPGPVKIPLLGCIHIFTLDDFAEDFQPIVKRYGDVVMIHFGPNPYVFLNSPEAIREAFVKKADSVSARPKQYLIEIMTRGKGMYDYKILITYIYIYIYE